MGAHANGDLDPAISALIKYKASRLVGRFGFARSDSEDLQQELSMQVVRGLERHDPGRAGLRTYADRIVTSKIASIIEHATAKKRDRRKERAIDSVAETAFARHEPSASQVHLAIEVRDAVQHLPDELRTIAQLLMQHSEAEAMRICGLSRQQLRSRRQKIAECLRRMGFGPQ